jgi:tetratricopeptide (TPR) repeat protein
MGKLNGREKPRLCQFVFEHAVQCAFDTLTLEGGLVLNGLFCYTFRGTKLGEINMSKPRNFYLILVPAATVFLSSGCIMVLELVAGRLTARHLGSSLYTWTSVIGVVLAGITIGNYLGGRIADRFHATKALSVLFGIASVTCVGTVVLNNLVGGWMFLWYMSWPLRVFTHVAIVFLIPSTLLGTISPVVAKMALDRGLPTGRTVGDIYAWGAAGSIAGTFLAGFYLIAAMGTVAIVWAVSAVLLLMAILYWARLLALYFWTAVFIALMTVGMAPAQWAERTGSSLALREQPDPHILYRDETQYNYVAVVQLSTSPDKREFVQDKLTHSIVIMDDIRDLQYFYQQIYAAVTNQLSQGSNTLCTLTIGGGGYVFPRYIEDVWPGSRVDVVEIDPGVTEAAIQAFGLNRDTTINLITMDARNYVDGLLQRARVGQQVPKYDFIYEDAIKDCTVPYQLVTKEFNDKIDQILTDGGAYMVNLIDVFESGLFIGSLVNTLEQTFPYVYVVTRRQEGLGRSTFVIIAARRQINLEDLRKEEAVKDLDLWILTDSDIEALKKGASRIVLTDDYAPVENLVAPVVRHRAVGLMLEGALELAKDLKLQGRFLESIAMYEKILKVRPVISIYCEVAAMQVQLGRLNEAEEAFRRAIEHNKRAKIKVDPSGVHLELALVLKRLKQLEKSRQHFRRAIDGFRKELADNPDSADTLFKLGVALTEVGRFDEGTKYLRRATNIDPFDVKKHLTLAQTLLTQQRYDEAIKYLSGRIQFMSEHDRSKDVAELQEFLESVKLEKSKQKKQQTYSVPIMLEY